MPSSEERHAANYTCARCRAEQGVFLVRSEQLCRLCFAKYVGAKVIKRLVSGNVRGGFHEAQKQILIPVGMDVSSACLLQLLDHQRTKRLDNGQHPGYQIHTLFIEDANIQCSSSNKEQVVAIMEQFPDIICHSIHLEEVLSYEPSLCDFVLQRMKQVDESNLKNVTLLQQFLASTISATSREDLIGILWRRLIHAFAAQNHIDSILFSDSSTQLAQRVLSETAKGRGGSLPWLASDHQTSDGIPCFFPMQDLLEKEVILFAQISDVPLISSLHESETTTEKVSSKDMTIDELTKDYFSTVEAAYPSIVTNVTRTSNKLRVQNEDAPRCRLCSVPGGDEQVIINKEHSGRLPGSQRQLPPAPDLCLSCMAILQQ